MKNTEEEDELKRIFEGDLANGETFFFGRHSKHENLTMLSVSPLNSNMVRKCGRKSVQCSVRPIKLGLCLGWKGQLICCVTRGEGGREGVRGRRER